MPLRVFDIINFLLLFCAPEKLSGIFLMSEQQLGPFADQKIFPESSAVHACSRGRKIGNESVADTIIIKIYFSASFKLVADVAA